MTQLTIGDKEICLVEVSEDANGFEVSTEFNCIAYYLCVPAFHSIRDIPLPPGSWLLLGRGSEISLEQWESILPKFNNPFLKGRHVYIDYTKPESHTVADATKDAKESGLSLLTSQGFKKENTIILIKE